MTWGHWCATLTCWVSWTYHIWRRLSWKNLFSRAISINSFRIIHSQAINIRLIFRTWESWTCLLTHDLAWLLVLRYSWSSRHYSFRLLTNYVTLMSHLLSISDFHPLWLFPASMRTPSDPSHFFLQSGLLLLLTMSLVLSLVKEGPAHFLFALFYLFKQV